VLKNSISVKKHLRSQPVLEAQSPAILKGTKISRYCCHKLFLDEFVKFVIWLNWRIYAMKAFLPMEMLQPKRDKCGQKDKVVYNVIYLTIPIYELDFTEPL
jgi:hypothetical protein